ncbi:MAG: succinylglutamate desuccinylase/aspartoacylase family protein [bacterium]|nr:succinylglutamate desuccinylase/aspartoacylase family protein [bacterium]
MGRAVHDAAKIGGLTVAPGMKATGWLPVMETLGQEVRIPLAVVHGVEPGPCVHVNAGVHALEYAAIEAAVKTFRTIDPKTLRGTVVVVPVLNMPAFMIGAPYVVPLDNQNLNRVFPGGPDGTASQRIAHTVLAQVTAKCQYLVDLHGGDLPEILFPFAIFYRTGNTSTDAESERIARAFGTEYLWVNDATSGNPGTFVREAARLGVAGFVSEVGGLGSYAEEHVAIHFKGVQNVLKELKMIPGTPDGVPASAQKIRAEAYGVTAPCGGVFHPLVHPGQQVAKGTPLAEITDVFGERLAVVTAPASGTVRILFVKRVVNAGDTLMKCFADPK